MYKLTEQFMILQYQYLGYNKDKGEWKIVSFCPTEEIAAKFIRTQRKSLNHKIIKVLAD